jgi:DeoR family ulaG and ulaABCDEF operon transcriptional repressor
MPGDSAPALMTRGCGLADEQLILLVDSSKFQGPSGNIVCGLDEIDIVVTDSGIERHHRKMLESADLVA